MQAFARLVVLLAPALTPALVLALKPKPKPRPRPRPRQRRRRLAVATGGEVSGRRHAVRTPAVAPAARAAPRALSICAAGTLLLATAAVVVAGAMVARSCLRRRSRRYWGI